MIIKDWYLKAKILKKKYDLSKAGYFQSSFLANDPIAYESEMKWRKKQEEAIDRLENQLHRSHKRKHKR